METWSNIVEISYNFITGYMVILPCQTCQPPNRLLNPEDESPRPVPGIRQYALLAGPSGADRNAERTRGSGRLDCGQRGPEARQAAGAARIRARPRVARTRPSSVRCPHPGQGPGSARRRELECRAVGSTGAHDAQARARRLCLGCRHALGNGARPAGAGAVDGGRPSDRAQARPCAALRQSRMRLAVPRRQPRRQAALVLDAKLRQPRQGAAALPQEPRSVRQRKRSPKRLLFITTVRALPPPNAPPPPP